MSLTNEKDTNLIYGIYIYILNFLLIVGLWSEWVGGYNQYVYYSQVFSFLKTEFLI